MLLDKCYYFIKVVIQIISFRLVCVENWLRFFESIIIVCHMHSCSCYSIISNFEKLLLYSISSKQIIIIIIISVRHITLHPIRTALWSFGRNEIWMQHFCVYWNVNDWMCGIAVNCESMMMNFLLCLLTVCVHAFSIEWKKKVAVQVVSRCNCVCKRNTMEKKLLKEWRTIWKNYACSYLEFSLSCRYCFYY